MKKRSNNEIINQYFRNLCSEKQYSFLEAKEQYINMISTNDEQEKLKLRENLICGTLNLLKKYIENSLLSIIDNNILSLEDILSDCVEIYISLIDSGILLQERTFSSLFNHNFLYKIADKYDKTISNTNIYKKYLIDVLNWYNKEYELEKEVNYNKYYNVWKDKLSNDYEVYRMYILVKSLNDIFCDNNIKIKNYDLQVLRKLLIYINYEQQLFEENYIEGSTKSIDEVENKIIEEEIKDCLKVLTDKQLIILKEHYGFDEKERTYEEIADDYKVTKGCINNSIKISCKKLLKFKGKELKKLRLVYDGSKSK